MSPSVSKETRRPGIPIIYTRGTHYEVGLDVGRTFSAVIKSFLKRCDVLHQEYLPLYNTPEGHATYTETLNSVKKSFPQYVRELEGIAEGAQVEFHLLFLMHLDEILPVATERRKVVNQPVGCSTICVSQPDCEILGHTEDALSETLNHWYMVDAHIISETPQGRYGALEEHFTSLCYAGHLPGYTMSYNRHGLVFSINTLSAKLLQSGKTPRQFITRAMLGAKSFGEVQTIMRDHGVGAADGCSVNLTFLTDQGERKFTNIEMGPVEDGKTESQLNLVTKGCGEHMMHANRYLRLQIPEMTGLMIESSDDRMQTFQSYPAPRTRNEVIQMLGDTSCKRNTVFRDNDEIVKTIAVGIFDLQKRTWDLYSDNPKTHQPVLSLQLQLKPLGEPNTISK